ncbi:MAG: sulfatase-like hydrolase/transferase [Planctomycetota bacterium]|jgi:arylsulfatase A-like enzyme
MSERIDRRRFLKMACAGIAAGTIANPCVNPLLAMGKVVPFGKLPNIIVIFADDLGYGDLSCFGHPTIHTPNLDRMAAEGMKLTQFYSAAPVCTPSRAALLTGRLPIRNHMACDQGRVLFPSSKNGLPTSEITIAKALKVKGYATCCIGKWHLGHLPKYLPTSHGFDYYYGIPYSNDMKPAVLIENKEVIEDPADQTTLTKRYTEKAVKFIEQNKSKPFFLYFPHTFPHVPLFASKKFKDKSLRGLYGDVVEELDWSVGKVLDTLKKLKLDKNTFVVFTSDNGPWLIRKLHGGTAGLLRGGKGSTWDGGMREPCIARWPGKIKAGSFSPELSCTMDIFATCLDFAGLPLPKDRQMDCVTMKPILFGTGKSKRNVMFFYRESRLMAVRKGPWKAHFITQAGYRDKPKKHDPPLLFHLEYDPSERFDVAGKHQDVIADIQREVERHKQAKK